MTPAIVTQAERIVRAYQQRPSPIIEHELSDVRTVYTKPSDAFAIFGVVSVCALALFLMFVGAVDVVGRIASAL